MTELNNRTREIVSAALKNADPQRSIGQDGPEAIEEPRIFVGRLDIHDRITLINPDGPESPVAILCKEIVFHTDARLESDSDIVVFADYAEGMIVIENTAGQDAIKADEVEGVSPIIEGTPKTAGRGDDGRNAGRGVRGIPPQYWEKTAKSGKRGKRGYEGDTGRKGEDNHYQNDGADAGNVTFFAKAYNPESILDIAANGGDAGHGGKGGTGGQGQKGGKGGTGGAGGKGLAGVSGPKKGGKGGTGGRGGQGGRGGRSGDGGDGGDITFYYLEGSARALIEIFSNSGGNPGKPGDGGDGGRGGEGGDGGKGGNGGDGDLWTEGKAGKGKLGHKGEQGPRGPHGPEGSKGEVGKPGNLTKKPRKSYTAATPEVAERVATMAVPPKAN